MNYCQYDHNLDKPCGKPAQMKLMGMHLCPEHYDETMRLFGQIGIDPCDPNGTPAKEEPFFDDGEL
jgi:hypothetical protein